jgi:hypothetical protein
MTCAYAAESGQLECLIYAHTHSCHWNKEECLKISIKQNKTLIVKYIENLLEDTIADGSSISLNCNICKINKKCVVYQPCNHLLSCWSCAVKTAICPNCNQKISSFFKVFFP